MLDTLDPACYRLPFCMIWAHFNEYVNNFLVDFCIILLKPLFCNLPSSVGNSTVCMGQNLKQFSFWNNFLVVFCEEFAIVVNPFLSSYCLLFPF